MRTEPPHLRLPLLAGSLVTALALLAGCNGAGADAPDSSDGDTQSPSTSRSEGTRAVLSQALAAAGHASDAELVQQEATTVSPVEAPFLESWRILKIHSMQPSHPVLFYVGFDGERVLRLTGNPGSFNEMTAADGGTVDDAGTAEALAATYIETTRSMSTLSYVVGSIDDIRWRSNLEGTAKAKRQRITERYRDVLAPPTAHPQNGAYVVRAYVIHGQTLERRTLTVHPDATVQQDTAELTSEVPVPLSR